MLGGLIKVDIEVDIILISAFHTGNHNMCLEK